MMWMPVTPVWCMCSASSTTATTEPRLGPFTTLCPTLTLTTLWTPQYPITATQWHPEKNAFEWPSFLHIPHSPDAVEVGQEVANFFVGEARRNAHAAVRYNAAHQPISSSPHPLPLHLPTTTPSKHIHTQRDELEEQDLLIYNWAPQYTGRQTRGANGGRRAPCCASTATRYLPGCSCRTPCPVQVVKNRTLSKPISLALPATGCTAGPEQPGRQS